MPDLDSSTLLVLVPALPLVGALLTVALGRLLGPRAHWPAILSIAAAAVAAVTLLVGLGREVFLVEKDAHGTVTTGSVAEVQTLWQWASIPDAYTPPAGSAAIDVDGRRYLLHSFDRELRESLRAWKAGEKVRLIGELGLYKGNFQFVIHHDSWMNPAP